MNEDRADIILDPSCPPGKIYAHPATWNRWAAFTDEELAVLDICTAIPAGLREDQRRIETELVAEIHARNIRRKT